MMRRSIVVCCILLVLCLWAVRSGAEWVEDGTAICTEVNQQGDAKVLTYPEGLYFVTWSDQRNLTNGSFLDEK